MSCLPLCPDAVDLGVVHPEYWVARRGRYTTHRPAHPHVTEIVYPSRESDPRWIAFESDESGSTEIYVAPFPGPGGKRRISASGGTQPRWSEDGREIFYVGADARLMVAGVNVSGDLVSAGEPNSLRIGPLVTSRGIPYALSRNGQRILAAVPAEQRAGGPLTFIQGWTATLNTPR